MIALTSAGFLPTNTSEMDSPFMIAAFVVGGLLVVAIIGFLIWMRHDFEVETTYWAFLGFGVAFLIPAFTAVALSGSTVETNRNNLTENIKTVYDIENVMFEDDPAKNEKIAKASPLTVTVTKDGKAYKVILNQDKTTFEPNLSSFENDSIDIETLKRDKR
jgi:hypothetical protein